MAFWRQFKRAKGFYILVKITSNNRLPNNGIPKVFVVVFANRKKRQLIVLVGFDIRIEMTCQKGTIMFGFLGLIECNNRLKQVVKILPAFHAFLRVFAVIALFLAISMIEIFAKVMQYELTPAHRSFGIRNDFVQELLANFLFSECFSLQKLFEFFDVFVAVKSNALSYPAVSACSTCFLVIAFDGFRDVMMNDITYIWLVYAHTKGNSSDDHLDFFHEKCILVFGSGTGI